MNRFISLRSFFSLCFSLILLGAISYTNIAFAKPEVTLRVYSSLNATDQTSNHVFFKKFQELVTNKYGDRIKFDYFPNGILGKEADAIQQLRRGAIDITLSGTSIWSTIVPELGVLDLGYLYNSFDDAGKFLDEKPGNYLANLLLEKGNAIVLGYGYSLGARNIYTIKPITQYADLQSKKIRVLPVKIFIETINHMGAVAIPMPFGEVYSGLQMGVVDGVEHDNPTILVNKYYEVAKYALETAHIYNPMLFAMNKSALNKIPEDMRQGFLDAAHEATRYERSQAMVLDQEAKNELIKLGMQYSQLDRSYFRKAVQPVWDEFFAQYPDTKFMLDYVGKSE